MLKCLSSLLWLCALLTQTACTPSSVEPIATHANLAVSLTEVAKGFNSPTDVQFVPGQSSTIVVLEKAGKAFWYDLATKQKGLLFSVKVNTEREEGLLGLAFPPGYLVTHCFYINYVTQIGNQSTTRVAEWCGAQATSIQTLNPSEKRTILEQPQPFANHKGGLLAFGADQNLYIALGDGGDAGDPLNNAQNLQTWLGKILRIRLTAPGASPAYTIPPDNPFVDHPNARKEIWAYGLRNPWRGSFDDRGRLVMGDPGQKLYEELDIIVAGNNHGWPCKEGLHDYRVTDTCATQKLIEPIHEYGRDQGFAITGGFQWRSSDAPALMGLHIFGDYGSGRVWGIALPEGTQKASAPVELGKFDISPVTFARDVEGRIYVADHAKGSIFRLTPKS